MDATAALGAHESQARPSAAEPSLPGRTCPISYRYSPEVFRRPAELATDTLYVVGGLYGNPFALEAVLARASREGCAPRIVFNGDFHWFDIDPADFERVNSTVLQHTALRGNVETELSHDDAGAGCGCGYPQWVGDGDVARSNAILEQLRDTADRWPQARRHLGELPMHLVAAVGEHRIGIVHGDCWSLAGWGFTQETLEAQAPAIESAFAEAAVEAFASSHTCLPVARVFRTARGPRALINNGAAGMPNFAGTHYGIVTRVATTEAPDALYRARLGAIAIEALPLAFDAAAWRAHFVQRWPPDSPASVSYLQRISEGPAYTLLHALRGGFERGDHPGLVVR
jgi:hypothetical protein